MEKLFQKNEGTIDRAARVTIGLAGIGMFFFGPQTPLGLLGLVPLATGLLGSCPLYSLLGISTCKVKAAT